MDWPTAASSPSLAWPASTTTVAGLRLTGPIIAPVTGPAVP